VRLKKKYMIGLVVICVSGIIGWSLHQSAAGPAKPLDQLMPEGALLYIEAKDFSGLLKDWSASPEKAEWLKSDDYRVFSNSRLFLRLQKASEDFAKATGVPQDMKFLTHAAGKESALAIYDIGKLEFLYVGRVSSGDFAQSPLWQSRNKFESRTSAGRPFFTRTEQESGRVVAFAVVDDYVVLGTRENLVAGALELFGGSQARSLHQEEWYTHALAAAPSNPGDLRMVMHMEKIAITPHFRTYWLPQNITEMQSYSSAVSDLYREGPVYREERVILPKKTVDDEASITQPAQAVTALLRLVPNDYGFYQAGVADPKTSVAAVTGKILTPRVSAITTDKVAPQVQLTGGATGSGSDLETRIDVEPVTRAGTENAAAELQKEFERAGPQAMLVVQGTRKNTDGVLLKIPSLVVVSAAMDWDLSKVQKTVQDVVAPGITASRLGVQWREVKDGGGYYEFDGLVPVAVAIRGKLLYFANDTGLLVSVLQTNNPAPAQPLNYAARFSHSRERQNFYRLTALADQNSAASQTQPQFFSGNLASFSRTFAKVDSEEVAIRQSRDKIQQTVTYRWTR
jgi:hypothetical protein